MDRAITVHQHIDIEGHVKLTIITGQGREEQRKTGQFVIWLGDKINILQLHSGILPSDRLREVVNETTLQFRLNFIDNYS